MDSDRYLIRQMGNDRFFKFVQRRFCLWVFFPPVP